MIEPRLAIIDRTKADRGALVSGGYFYHRAPRAVLPAARSHAFQDQLLDELARLTGERLPAE